MNKVNKAVAYSLGMIYSASIESEKLLKPTDKKSKRLLSMLQNYSRESTPFV